MTSFEAEVFPQGRITDRRKWKSLKKAFKYYLTLISILVIAIALLVANNYSIYNHFAEISSNNRNVVDQAKNVVNQVSMLQIENKSLGEENQKLKEKLKELEAEKSEQLKKIEEIEKKSKEFSTQITELTKDNISLQNSLKIAASIGIKPKNYTEFRGISASRGSIERGTYIGRFKGTVYTPSKEECGNNNGITYSGKPIIPGVSVAVDIKYWPLGTVFYIRGLGYAVAMDIGSAIKGKYRFDFAVFDKEFAKALGSRDWDVYLIKKGNGKIEDIKF